jgi:hypothetical protein
VTHRIAAVFLLAFFLHAADPTQRDADRAKREAEAKVKKYEFMLGILEQQMATSNRPSAEPLGEASFYAFQIGDYEKARAYATEGAARAKKRSDYASRYAGQTIYYAHWTLGRLALRDGDAETARNELLLSGKTPGSDLLEDHGPNMQLADDLLRRPGSSDEDRQAVIQFFDECAAFWPHEDLKVWKAAVQSGEIPTFFRTMMR